MLLTEPGYRVVIRVLVRAEIRSSPSTSSAMKRARRSSGNLPAMTVVTETAGPNRTFGSFCSPFKGKSLRNMFLSKCSARRQKLSAYLRQAPSLR